MSTGSATDLLGPDDGRSRGDRQAQVVLIEYSDFTCGFCKKFFLETWPRINANYVETGKVRFLYRDYPRADRGPGLDAAMAARCAGEQGKYWAMHDRLFGGNVRFGDAVFGHYARAIGLDLRAFAKCREKGQYRSAIFQDRAQGAQWGFRGTPGFVLIRLSNGRVDMERHRAIAIPGAFPYEVFEEQIEGLLAKVPS